MIVNKKHIRFGATDILAAVISVLFCAGLRIWFPVCEAMDEHIMSCHWAGEALKALSLLIAVLAVIHIFIPDAKVKTGIDIAAAGIAVLMLRIPGGIINICANNAMRCHSTQLWTVIFSAAALLICAVDAAVYLSAVSKENHSRK